MAKFKKYKNIISESNKNCENKKLKQKKEKMKRVKNKLNIKKYVEDLKEKSENEEKDNSYNEGLPILKMLIKNNKKIKTKKSQQNNYTEKIKILIQIYQTILMKNRIRKIQVKRVQKKINKMRQR